MHLQTKIRMKKKTNKYTPGQAITNIDELRAAKRYLKRQINESEHAQDNSILGKAVGFIGNMNSADSIVSNRIQRSLNLVAEKISTRYPMGGVSKYILSGLVVITVPIITSKLQKFIQKKLS